MGEQLKNEVRELVARIIKLPVAKVAPQANLFTDLNVDSLVGMEIFAALDKKYGIVIPENRLHEITTLADIAELVAELLAGKGKS
jgi:acyl carrier protein